MNEPNASIEFHAEPWSNQARQETLRDEPIGLRTFTPSQLVIAKSAGLFHFTPEGRKLADFTSGVLVANLGHHPRHWMARFGHYLGWQAEHLTTGEGYAELPPLTAYNAISTLEVEANRRLLRSLHTTPFGQRMEQVLWSASGSEGVQKALWSCLKARPDRGVILATRHGFHGKKGLSEAVTGDEHSPNRDPRVTFISFPKQECANLDRRQEPFDPTPYRLELDKLWEATRGGINCLITEPYLGGGGSFHPPMGYLPMLQAFCRDHAIPFILDEVQSNFGRTGAMYAFEHYGLEPDLVVLGKGMGNGVPVNAVVGRRDLFASLGYGGGSDTWSGHPMGCAATLATLDCFEQNNVLGHANRVSAVIETGLRRLAKLPIVAAIRGEGMVWGIELAAHRHHPREQVAIDCVRACYLGDSDGNAIHLLGPLAGYVLRVSPPLTMTLAEATHYMAVMERLFQAVAGD
jgi:4-aminobutyrate aminotransferase-like enzyme